MATNTGQKSKILPAAVSLISRVDQFEESDLVQIACIYQREMGQGFLSSLGDEVALAIFETALQSPDGFLIAARDNQSNQICGFVCGAVSTGAFYKAFLLQKWLVSLRYVVPKLLTPARLWRAMETLFYPTRRTATSFPSAELLVIAVQHHYRGRGTAQQLFSMLQKRFADKGIDQFKVAVGATLPRACRFYEKLNPISVNPIEVHQGQPSLIYVYETK
ncbi:MAG: GNAT family N-acetyltransferase [Chloroflexota bacterium]